MEIKKVGVVGCGLMGSGVAQVYPTLVREPTPEILDRGLSRISAIWSSKPSSRTWRPRSRVGHLSWYGGYPVGRAKAAINKATQTDLNTGLPYEIEAVSLTFATEDEEEGMSAY